MDIKSAVRVRVPGLRGPAFVVAVGLMMMPRFVVLLLLIAAGARAGEVTVRQLAGIGVSGSDSGFGLAAQLGIRISPVLLRATLDIGGGTSPHGYAAASVRADWVQPVSSAVALIAGIGIGSMSYGFIYDSPTGYAGILTPEIGLLLGQDRLLGRILLGVTGVVPTGSVPRPTDSFGQTVSPPHVMVTALLSL